MAGAAPNERLRSYLQELKPEARAMLLEALERGRLRGSSIPGSDLILRALLPDMEARPRRVDTPARVFFAPLDPFLCDAGTARRRPSRIERPALTAIWQWIGRDLEPEAARTYSRQIEAAFAVGDDSQVATLTRDFQNRIAQSVSTVLSSANHDQRARRRLIGQLGLAEAHRDLQTLHNILAHRDALSVLAQRLPAMVQLLDDEQLISVHAAVRIAVATQPAILAAALTLVMTRLACPWHLLRLAIRSADTDTAAKVAQSPLAYAVTLVIADTASVADDLRASLKTGRFVLAARQLKALHDAVRAMRSDLDLSGVSSWGRELAALRGEISDIVQAEIDTAPGRVRRLMRPRTAAEIRPDSLLDVSEVQETQALIAFVGVCRNCASELAINHPASHAYSALRSLVDSGVPSLVEALRGAGPAERAFRRSQVDAAIRFAQVLFGPDYASAIARAAEIPAQTKAASA